MQKKKIITALLLTGAMLCASLPMAALQEAQPVEAASGHWELVSKSKYSTASPWHVDNWGADVDETFQMDFKHNGFKTDLSTSYTAKGSGKTYAASTGYTYNYLDMDVKIGGPETTYAGGAQATIPYAYTIRRDYRVNGDESYSYSSCGELVVKQIRWETDTGYDYLKPDKNSNGGYLTTYMFPEAGLSGNLVGTLPTGTKAGEKMTLTFMCCNSSDTAGSYMSSTYIYNWTNGSNSNTTSKKPGKVTITKIYNKNAVYPHGVKVVWKKLTKNVKGYQMQVSTSSSFKKPAGTAVQKSNVWNIGTNKGQKVWVRVRAFNIVNGKRVYGAWSKVKSKKAK